MTHIPYSLQKEMDAARKGSMQQRDADDLQKLRYGLELIALAVVGFTAWVVIL